MSDISVMDVETLIERAGGVSKFAAKLNLRHPTICDWKRTGFLPGSRVVQISDALDIPVEEIAKLIRPLTDKRGEN